MPQRITTTGAGLKRFEIRIHTGHEMAIIAAMARSQGQAWCMAFNHAERLCGDTLPRRISVRAVAPRSGLHLPAHQALQPLAVGLPVPSAGRGHTSVAVQKNEALCSGLRTAVKADGRHLPGAERLGEHHHPLFAH